jgi:hypothetical protein
MNNVEKQYEKRRKRYEELNRKQTRQANLMSNIRLLIFAVGLIMAGLLYYINLPILCVTAVIITVSVFIYVVIQHQKILGNKQYSLFLTKINEDALLRVSDGWKEFEDTGEEFVDKENAFSYDLDVFGKGSLFQMINMTHTHSGRKAFAQRLSAPAAGLAEILDRQNAIRELSRKLSWRQKYAAEGMGISGKLKDPGFLYEWIQNRNMFYSKDWVKPVFRIVPALTLLLLFASVFLKLIPLYLPVLLLVVQVVTIKVHSKERGKILEAVSKYKEGIKVYEAMLIRIEKARFESPLLIELKKRLVNKQGLTASKQVNKLSKLVDSISNRYNFFYMIFDILTLWDYQCMIALEEWKGLSGVYLKQWLETIGDLEALSSLAVLGYDNAKWAVPELTDKPLVYTASGMGHPLLGKKGVRNNLVFEQSTRVLLITGSNMSGKSTLLRTAGINLVLAYSGAVVCAESFCCSMLEVFTCMRISDNLEKSISSFYAELLRIKLIVQAAREGRKIFFLLDEIFKGTNSVDRHLGAKVLVNKLSEGRALGLVSTHDLELGELETENNSITNYHFREYYEGDQIHFDYKLQNGISTTRNAIYLMKLAGLEFK